MIKILVTFLLMAPTFAVSQNKLIPINPQETAFFNYLKKVARLRFIDRLPTEPWFECVEGKSNNTFFSGGLYSFTDNRDVDDNVEAFVATLLDHAFWSKVGFAQCRFDIDHFNECKAQGFSVVHFKNQRLVYFHRGPEKNTCPTSY